MTLNKITFESIKVGQVFISRGHFSIKKDSLAQVESLGNNQPITKEQRTDLLRLGVMKCYRLKQKNLTKK
jgi:hypothetical protein